MSPDDREFHQAPPPFRPSARSAKSSHLDDTVPSPNSSPALRLIDVECSLHSRIRPPMELRYLRDVADDHGLDWEYTEKVLSSRDIDDWMHKGW